MTFRPFIAALLTAGTTVAQQAAPPAATAVQPKPLTPAPLEKPKSKALDITEIHADSIDFNPKTSIYTFTGNVDVKNPGFHLTTDGTFEVKMKKEDKKAAPAATAAQGETKAATPSKPDAKSLVEAPVSTPGATPASQPAKEENNVQSAIARGKMVVIEKMGDDGKMKVGQSRYAYYEGKTGDITLRDWPQVSDGQNMIIAIDATTIMILTADGKLRTEGGRTETRIIQGDGKGGTKSAKGSGGLSLPTPRPAQ